MVISAGVFFSSSWFCRLSLFVLRDVFLPFSLLILPAFTLQFLTWSLQLERLHCSFLQISDVGSLLHQRPIGHGGAVSADLLPLCGLFATSRLVCLSALVLFVCLSFALLAEHRNIIWHSLSIAFFL